MTVFALDVVLHQASGELELNWSDGLRRRLAGHGLRAACRCSACESQRRAGRAPVPEPGVTLTGLHPIGDIGLQLVFSDGHERGIFPWPYLRQLSVGPSGNISPPATT